MLNKYLLIALIGIGMLSLVSPYTAPTYDDVNFTLCSDYTPPTYDSINFTLGTSDACGITTYNLNITNPTSSSPLSVSSGDKVSLYFNFSSSINGAIDENVSVESILIGGSEATILTETSYPEFIGAGSIVGDPDRPITLTVTCPSYLKDDILIISWYNSGGDPITTSTTGWTSIDALAEWDDAGWMWKRATDSGTTGATLTSVDDNDYAQCYVIRGTLSTDTPFDDTWETNSYLMAASSTDAPYTDEIETSGDNRLVVVFEQNNDEIPTITNYPPSGWTGESSDDFADAGTDATFIVISKEVASAGTVSSVKVSDFSNAEMSATLTIAFIPESSEAQQVAYINSSYGWVVNVTTPNFDSGLKDLFINATYDGNTENDTETNATNYGAADTCTCTGLNQDWEINMSDYCVIIDDCNLGTGTLNFTGIGNCTINAVIDTTDLGDPGSNATLWINSEGIININ